MTSYTCKACAFHGKKKQDNERHVLTKKHNKGEATKETYKCNSCDTYLNTKCNYMKHLNTQKHIKNMEIHTCKLCAKTYKTRSRLLNHEKQCNLVEQVKQDPNLIKYVMSHMTKQNETMQALVAKVGNTTIHNNTLIDHSVHNKFNLNIFLNEKCKDAINWSDFIQNINVSLNDLDVQSNITDKVIGTICKELSTLGLYKRPIHCTDVKRHKSCIKNNNEWKRDAATLIRDGILNVSKKFQQKVNEWTDSHPNWNEDERLADQYVSMVSVYMKEPDDEKCTTQIYKLTPI